MRYREEKREVFICECGREIVCEAPGCGEFAVEDERYESSYCDFHTDEAYEMEEAELQVERYLEARAFESEDMNK